MPATKETTSFVKPWFPQADAKINVLVWQAACRRRDFDHDNDVDQADFGIFQRCFSGPNATPPANCGT